MNATCICITAEQIGANVPTGAYAAWLAQDFNRDCPEHGAPVEVKRCLIRNCPMAATIGGLCDAHHDWAYRVLADDRYRTETPPVPRIEGTSVHGVLL